MLTRDFTFAEGRPRCGWKCRPPRGRNHRDGAVGVGRVAAGNLDEFTVVAAGTAAGLPTRTCTTHDDFRFIGLAPGKYSLRISTKEETFQPVEASVEKGKTTWLGPIYVTPVKTKE